MLQIKPMTIKDEAQVMEMVRDFYHSDAVDHVVGDQVLHRTFRRGGSGTELVGIGSVGWRPGGWFQLSHQLLRLRVRGKDLDD